MGRYIYGARNGIHIIDLTQTVPLLDAALQAMRDSVAKGGRILFVGTKRQAAQPLADAAGRSAQYFMNHRWLGGTLTNWKTVSNSINRLKALDEQLDGGAEGFTKKERLKLERERTKLQLSLGGIRDMGSVPDMVFVIDTNKEALAIAEAKKLGIPVVAVVDTNSDPVGIDYPIPGNDDASRAIGLYTDLAARAALDGMTSQLGAAGFDLGELEDAPIEEAVAAEVEAAATADAPVEAAAEAAATADAPVEAAAEAAATADAPVEAAAEAAATADAPVEAAAEAAATADAPVEAAAEATATADAPVEAAAEAAATADAPVEAAAEAAATADAPVEAAAEAAATADAPVEAAAEAAATADAPVEAAAEAAATADAPVEAAAEAAAETPAEAIADDTKAEDDAKPKSKAKPKAKASAAAETTTG